METKKIMEIWRELLIAIGENPDREGLKDTPKRIARMYGEIFRGYQEKNKPKITTFKNGVDGISYSGIVCDKGYFFSHCEHHGMPFFGEYYLGYIPDKKIIGLSKLARVVDYYSSRFQIQERLSKEILNHIDSVAKPRGAILILKEESTGVFKENTNGVKIEFLKILEGFDSQSKPRNR